MLQIVLMESPEGRFVTVQGNALETLPVQSTNTAVVVSLAAEIEPAHWQRRQLGNRTRSDQSDGNAFMVGVEAGDPRNSRDQHVSFICDSGFATNLLTPAVIHHRERSCQHLHLG